MGTNINLVLTLITEIGVSALFQQQVLGHTTCDVHVDCNISLTLNLSNFYFINAPLTMREMCNPLGFHYNSPKWM